MHRQTFRAAVQMVSKPNNDPVGKPNEDFVLANTNAGIFIVCDGVSRSLVDGRYPHPSPAAAAAQVFACTAYDALATYAARTTPATALRAAIAAGNQQIARYNAHHFRAADYVEHDLAGTVAIVALIAGNALHYGFIGDCAGYWATAERAARFTEPQTARVAQYRVTLGRSRAATIEIRQTIRNNRAHPCGYGVITGERAALDFVEYGQVPLSEDQVIMLASDGVSDVLDARLAAVRQLSLEQIIAEAEQREVQRGLRSDDKTLIRLLISA